MLQSLWAAELASSGFHQSLRLIEMGLPALQAAVSRMPRLAKRDQFGQVAPLFRASRSCSTQLRPFGSGIKILEDAHRAEENRFFSREDERLMREMISKHPELSPECSLDEIIVEPRTTEDKVAHAVSAARH
eukprot:TRINITY_DN101970_c0_g1_i1.p2 TRINITY_DN101970_c0_g1~~TRINITY_DN101970_c0_g1_i1.p2  ORF type:complete len:141 (-),score=25.66 TRINITY_DN101970_c0_g1_i1:146-541(-)